MAYGLDLVGSEEVLQEMLSPGLQTLAETTSTWAVRRVWLSVQGWKKGLEG